MHSFFLRDIPEVDSAASLDARDEKHLFKTLRARIGETVELIDGAGVTACAEIQENRVLRIVQRHCAVEPAVKISVAVSTPRRAKMEQLLVQCAECGVWSIIPLQTDYSVATPEKEPDDPRRTALLLEACKQSRNPFMPKLAPTVKLNAFLDSPQAKESVLCVGDPYAPETLPTFRSVRSICFFVGPEGGFSEKETILLREHGAVPLRIGPYILRVETAVVAGVALIRGCLQR